MNKIVSQHRPIAIFLMGTTSSGKTSLAIKIAQKIPVDIISVDSALIYRGMNIGTGKPSKEELAHTPHRLIDICNPIDFYSVSNFYFDALKEMKKITSAGRIPLLVGGTMFYFKILLEGLSPLPATNYKIRNFIKNKAKIEGWNILYKKLKKIDPVSANRINPNDFQRLSRALEVFFVSGKTLTELLKISGNTLMYQTFQFAIAPLDRLLLHQRIEQRFHQMLAKGFDEEVNTLFLRGDLNDQMSAFKCIGYKQMWEYLSGNISYKDMIFSSIYATQQLAKRQITWLNKWKQIYWIENNNSFTSINKILQTIRI